MPRGETRSFGYHDSQQPFELLDVSSLPRAGLVARVEQWEWLHELRNRFDLAIEILDLDLQSALRPPPHRESAAALRAALHHSGPGTLRETAAAAVRSLTARSMTTGALRVRTFPMFAGRGSRPVPAGVVLIAGTLPQVHPSAVDAVSEIDRRLDATGQWLVAAIEAALAAPAQDVDAVQTTHRLAGIVDVIDALSRCDNDTEIVALVMDAIALWYDADVRVYRQDFSGDFVLHSCLPAVNPETVAGRLAGELITSRQDVFRLQSVGDATRLAWDGPVETTFVPLSADESVEWLVTVSGLTDPSFDITLGLLSRVVSITLTHLFRDAADRLRARLRGLLTFGDAPFDATTRLALEAIARETGALSAQITTYHESQLAPALVIGWASADDDVAPLVEPGTTNTTKHAITAGIAAGSGITAVLALRGQGTGFSNGSARLVQSAADMLGVWLSGAMVRPRDVCVVADSEYSTGFVSRLAGYVDRFGRLKTGGALAIVLPDGVDVSGVELDEVMQVVQDHVRSSDVVGVVGSGAGVLIPEATRAAASALADRLLAATRRPGCLPLKVGITTFLPLTECPDTLVRRALTNAQRGSLSS